MRRVFQQDIALDRRLSNQTKFTGFEIFETAVNKARRGRTRAGAKIAFIDDETAHALLTQITIKARAVDARPQNEHVNTISFELADAVLHMGTIYEIVHFTVFAVFQSVSASIFGQIGPIAAAISLNSA